MALGRPRVERERRSYRAHPDGLDSNSPSDFQRQAGIDQKAEPVTRFFHAGRRRQSAARAGVSSRAWAIAVVLAVALTAPLAVLDAQVQPQGRFLAKEDILLFGLGLKIEPAQQTVPTNIATIVSTMFVRAADCQTNLPPFAPDAVVKATLRGPTFPTPIELTVSPNSPVQHSAADGRRQAHARQHPAGQQRRSPAARHSGERRSSTSSIGC